MSGEFSICEFNMQKAIKYHHDFGDFDFLLMQASDGTKDIDFYASIKLSEHALTTIGFAAIRHLNKTAEALEYKTKGNNPNFYDAINILESALGYLEKRGDTLKVKKS